MVGEAWTPADGLEAVGETEVDFEGDIGKCAKDVGLKVEGGFGA